MSDDTHEAVAELAFLLVMAIVAIMIAVAPTFFANP